MVSRAQTSGCSPLLCVLVSDPLWSHKHPFCHMEQRGWEGELLAGVRAGLQVRCVTTLLLPVLSSGTLLPLQREMFPKATASHLLPAVSRRPGLRQKPAHLQLQLPLTSAQGAGQAGASMGSGHLPAISAQLLSRPTTANLCVTSFWIKTLSVGDSQRQTRHPFQHLAPSLCHPCRQLCVLIVVAFCCSLS